MTLNKINPNGVILHEDNTRVIIATGIKTKSSNEKTGDMIQIWILHRTLNPLEAIKTGQDEAICGKCIHRGEAKFVDGVIKYVNRRCYVQVDKAPNGIFKAYHRGSYRRVNQSEYPALFSNRMVRFGAYGDPVYIPFEIVEAITAVCKDWTGYTHQWRDSAYSAFRPVLMASADSVQDAMEAIALGWRYFRVRPIDSTVLAGEIMCPASEESGKRTTCAQCRLCNGVKHGADDRRKNITIIDHSRIAASKPLIQITAAA